MTQKNLYKKTLNGMLLCGVIIVWGGVVRQLFFPPHQEEAETNLLLENKEAGSIKFQFPENAIDPFFPSYSTVPKKMVVKEVVKNPIGAEHVNPLPNVKLLGIIEDNENLTAILEFDNDSLVYVGEGQHVRGLMISKISQKSIKYYFAQNMYALQLEE